MRGYPLRRDFPPPLATETFDLPIMFKLTIPTKDDLYASVIDHPSVLRVVALSGGYSRVEANEHLARNHGLIASFSRALTEGLTESMTPEVLTTPWPRPSSRSTRHQLPERVRNLGGDPAASRPRSASSFFT